VPWFMTPLCVSMMLLISFDTPVIIWVYMITNGLNGGMFGVVSNVLWAELYGTQNLGAIRSLITSTTIFAAALAPAVMGWLLDSGWTMRLIASVSLVYTLIAMVIAARVKIAHKPPPTP
jgi:MFS family permease